MRLITLSLILIGLDKQGGLPQSNNLDSSYHFILAVEGSLNAQKCNEQSKHGARDDKKTASF